MALSLDDMLGPDSKGTLLNPALGMMMARDPESAIQHLARHGVEPPNGPLKLASIAGPSPFMKGPVPLPTEEPLNPTLPPVPKDQERAPQGAAAPPAQPQQPPMPIDMTTMLPIPLPSNDRLPNTTVSAAGAANPPAGDSGATPFSPVTPAPAAAVANGATPDAASPNTEADTREPPTQKNQKNDDSLAKALAALRPVPPPAPQHVSTPAPMRPSGQIKVGGAQEALQGILPQAQKNALLLKTLGEVLRGKQFA